MDRAAYFAEHGHPPESAGRVCVDFDGVLYPKVGILDAPEPLDGAVEAMQRIARSGFHITIWTSRLWPEWLAQAKYEESQMRGYIETLLQRDGIPYNRLIGKPPGVAYIDDLAIRFTEGEWPALTDWLLWSREP